MSIFPDILWGALKGIKANLVKKGHFTKKFNICMDPEPMYHMTRAQTSRQNGGFSAMFISGNQIHWAIWFNACTARSSTLSPKRLSTIASARSVSIFLEVSWGALQGIKANLVKNRRFKWSYNVCVDPEPMYHVRRVQTSRQDGGLSAMFISWAIKLCNVSRVALH